MRGADLEAREAVERPFEDQMRQGDRGFEWVADGVRQETISGQPAARFQFAGAERVHEDEHPQLFALGPERVEFRVGEILAGDAAGHADAAEAERLDRLFDLFGGQVGILQCRGRKGDEPIRLRGAELDQGLVLDPDQFSDGIALGPVPVWIDAERLDIDARVIHLHQTVADIGPQETRRFERVIDQLRRLRDDAMRMHVNGLDPLATHNDFAAALHLRMARTAARLHTGAGAALTADKGQARASIHGFADRHFRSSRSYDSCKRFCMTMNPPEPQGWTSASPNSSSSAFSSCKSAVSKPSVNLS